MELFEALNWRYATKKMTGQTVPQEKIDKILEAIMLAASSAGLQPYKVFVISNHELKGKIHEAACMQPQVVEGSHFLVFASQTKLTAAYIDDYMQLIATTRGVAPETLIPFSDSLKGGLMGMPEEKQSEWAAQQAFIGLGFGLVAAATEQVDATPIGGFNAAIMDEVLNLKEQDLRSVVVMALGYRDEEKDFLAHAKKVRLPKEDFIVEIA